MENKSNRSYFHPHVKDGFVSSGDISLSPLTVRHSWCSPNSDNTTSKAGSTPPPSRAPTTVDAHSRAIVIPPGQRRAPSRIPYPCKGCITHSPEPLMCAGTRDRPPPLLVAAAWWCSRPSRVDAHRTSAVDGTIDLVRPYDGRRRAHVARWRELTARATRSHARTLARPRPRVFFAVRESRHRESERKKKTCAFIYGSRTSRVIGRQRLSLSLARGCVRLTTCRRVNSAHAASARATGGSINSHSW